MFWLVGVLCAFIVGTQLGPSGLFLPGPVNNDTWQQLNINSNIRGNGRGVGHQDTGESGLKSEATATANDEGGASGKDETVITSNVESEQKDETSVGKTLSASVRDGVDPAYLKIYDEAERRSSHDFESSHQRGEQGVVIGPVEGKQHVLKALQNARRIRGILGADKSVKLGLIVSPDDIKELENCDNPTTEERIEDCRLWANGTLFDDVVPTRSEDALNHEGDYSPGYWLKALSGYMNAPYKKTVFLDSDAYPCPGFENLFHLLTITQSKQKFWQLRTHLDADFAAGIDQYPFGTGCDGFIPGERKKLTDWPSFTERNTGTTIFNFERQSAHTFAHFIPLVAEHMYNNLETEENKIVNDQCPFRVAMYLFHRLCPDFVDHQIPQHSSCRTYPGKDYAGTDGFLNGMFPLQADGEHCSECHCTPCLVAHTAGYDVTIDGKMGWEPDEEEKNAESDEEEAGG